MYFLFFKLHSWGKRFGSSRRRFIQRFPSLLTLKLSFLSLRGGQKRSARRGTEGNTFRCNLLVPFIGVHSSMETLYREIAPQEYFFASLRAPRPFGPRNDSTIESFSINRLLRSVCAICDSIILHFAFCILHSLHFFLPRKFLIGHSRLWLDSPQPCQLRHGDELIVLL